MRTAIAIPRVIPHGEGISKSVTFQYFPADRSHLKGCSECIAKVKKSRVCHKAKVKDEGRKGMTVGSSESTSKCIT